ncbi:MAG: carboxypeptidase regulatory-like domain-containing protein [Acidobacteria bacterium]|nr:carboxypeptidase regulatory-like domain-containing protein [Acidobacteriota bacterium]
MTIHRLLIGFAAAALLCAQSRNAQPPNPQNKIPDPFFKGNKKDKSEDANLRALQGVIKDDRDNPVEGAVVKLKDTKSLQIRSFITKADGVYRFHGLNPNIDYEVNAGLQDRASSTRTFSVFDSRRAGIINLKLEKKAPAAKPEDNQAEAANKPQQ